MLDLEKKYNGKLLLFGEYLILEGGEAFALPLDSFYGQFQLGQNSNKLLPIALCHYLSAQSYSNASLKIELIEKAFNEGLSFNSTILSGYGNGSSGALSAALYDQFYDKTAPSLQNDRTNLSIIESFFQGKSSGIDPLVCYYNKTIYIKSDGSIEINIEVEEKNLKDWYLLDSHIPRNTEKLVAIFKENLSSNEYQAKLTTLKNKSNLAIKHFLNTSNKFGLVYLIQHVSRVQFDLFQDMILDTIKEHWSTGLSSLDYSIKLCGAGGGGFYLVHVPNVDKMQANHPELWQQLIPVVNVSL